MTVSETEEELGLPEYQLAYEVTDLEGNQLLPAGTQLTRQVMQDLAMREPGTYQILSAARFPGRFRMICSAIYLFLPMT